MTENPTDSTGSTKSVGIIHSKAVTKQNTQDRSNLVVAIMAAITAYIQMEQQTPSVST